MTLALVGNPLSPLYGISIDCFKTLFHYISLLKFRNNCFYSSFYKTTTTTNSFSTRKLIKKSLHGKLPIYTYGENAVNQQLLVYFGIKPKTEGYIVAALQQGINGTMFRNLISARYFVCIKNIPRLQTT